MSRAAQPFSGHSKIAMLACGAAAAAGLITWIVMLRLGLLETTGMENVLNWGVLISTFALLVGFGAGGAIVSSCIVISQEESLKPYALMMQAIAVAGAIGGGIAMLADLGSPFHMLAMLIHPNIASPLFWDMIALTAFIVIETITLAAMARGWKSERAWTIIGLLAALALQLIEGLLFALMTARAWWHSAIIPIDFIIVAGICGLSLALILSGASRRDESEQAASLIARTLLWLVVVHVILSLCEVIGLTIDNTADDDMALSLLGSYIVLYALEIALPVIGIAIALAIKRKDTFILGGALTIGGMIAHRLMLLYPAMGATTLFTELSNQESPTWPYPESTGFLESAREALAITQAYLPAVMELASTLLPVGLAGLIALLAYNLALASNGARGKDPQKAQSHRKQDEL